MDNPSLLDQASVKAAITEAVSRPRFDIDLSGWKAGDFEDWQVVARAGIMRDINPMMAQVVKRWPFSGDPSKVEAYREISKGEWKESAAAVDNAVAEAFKSAD